MMWGIWNSCLLGLGLIFLWTAPLASSQGSQAEVGKVCGGAMQLSCKDGNAVCRYDGSNTRTKMCLCKDGYVAVPDTSATTTTDTWRCAKKLPPSADQCPMCLNNEGTCYATKDDQTAKEGCLCPISRSGPDCEEVHVSVSCNLHGSRTMKICYTPHDNIDITDEAFKMYTENHGDNEQCKGIIVATPAQGDTCLQGSVSLTLDLEKNAKGQYQCGIQKLQPDNLTEQFIVKIFVDDKDDTNIFKTFCSYQTNVKENFGVIGINGVNGNDRGEHKVASLAFLVLDANDNLLSGNIEVLLGQKLKFKVELTKDDTYSAIRVEFCLASTMPSYPDPKAETIQLIVDACPADGQSIINTDNNFDILNLQSNVLSTKEPIKMFKLKTSSVVFVHCNVKLCLTGEEDKCQPKTCTPGGGSRKRRSTKEEVSETVHARIHVRTDESKNSGVYTGNWVTMLLVCLAALLVLSILVIVVMVWKMRTRQKNAVGDNPPSAPQQFALPRRNHTRI